ncbi:hypothetical protein [Methanobrevibacter sp. UBA212]|uniref:hypothetical protein n=1 Tax=Methanobrevibacter sp. UBA212 TaxID=1915476 RepID=UPI0025D34EB7|nr:hypothetical protein [Methanobrevibacter sp. UBA212]
MSIITILIWITIAIIAAIAIIVVKLHYRGDQLEHEEGSILPDGKSINESLSIGKNKDNAQKNNSSKNSPRSLSPRSPKEHNRNLFSRSTETKSNDDTYIVPEVETNNVKSYEYESQNQVLINYDNNVKKFQEPIKQSQMDIMTQNNKDTSELKDLFTIDELIKESKRKDSEREKESQTIRKDEDDAELNEIKESIKNKTQKPLIEEVIAEDKDETKTQEPLIKEAIAEDKDEKVIEEPAEIKTQEPLIKEVIAEDKDEKVIEEPAEIKTPSLASQKDIDEAITTASQESEKEVESISEDDNITDTLLKQEEIAEPALKTPSKVEKTEDNPMDLDYRKDLDKVKNKITSSKLFKEVKDKLNSEPEEIPLPKDDVLQEEFIRNVSEYDEYEPIINETYMDIDDGTYEDYHSQKIRQENTKRVFKTAQNSSKAEVSQPAVSEIKSKPERDNVKITINNTELVLKKGDEIIYNHDGETYSSQVYAITGDDISVRYRGKNIKIKTSDVKKIY